MEALLATTVITLLRPKKILPTKHVRENWKLSRFLAITTIKEEAQHVRSSYQTANLMERILQHRPDETDEFTRTTSPLNHGDLTLFLQEVAKLGIKLGVEDGAEVERSLPKECRPIRSKEDLRDGENPIYRKHYKYLGLPALYVGENHIDFTMERGIRAHSSTACELYQLATIDHAKHNNLPIPVYKERDIKVYVYAVPENKSLYYEAIDTVATTLAWVLGVPDPTFGRLHVANPINLNIV